MVRGVAWVIQALALVIVGTGLLVGLFYGGIRLELGMLAIGGGLFLFARWLDAGEE